MANKTDAGAYRFCSAGCPKPDYVSVVIASELHVAGLALNFR